MERFHRNKPVQLIILLSLASIWLSTSCMHNLRPIRGKSPVLLLKHDSGYITKAEVLPFLLTSGLTDTTKRFGDESYPHANDTIGKFYTTNTHGSKLLLVKLITKDSAKAFMLLEISAEGLLAKHTTYPTFGSYCLEDGIRMFQKSGKYFFLKDCGHGSGFSSEYAYVFDHVVPEDSLTAIYLGSYTTHGKMNFALAQLVSSEIETNDTSILVHYTIETGKEVGHDMKWAVVKKTDVRYVMKNGRWTASDSSLLKEMDME